MSYSKHVKHLMRLLNFRNIALAGQVSIRTKNTLGRLDPLSQGEKYSLSKSKNTQYHQKDVRTNPKRGISKLSSEAYVSYGTLQTT